jgi:hypothetical protein
MWEQGTRATRLRKGWNSVGYLPRNKSKEKALTEREATAKRQESGVSAMLTRQSSIVTTVTSKTVYVDVAC